MNISKRCFAISCIVMAGNIAWHILSCSCLWRKYSECSISECFQSSRWGGGPSSIFITLLAISIVCAIIGVVTIKTDEK